LRRPSAGMISQMRWEYDAAKELEIDWIVKMFCPTGWLEPDDVIQNSHSVNLLRRTRFPAISAIRDWIALRVEYHQWLKSQDQDVDVYILRYYVHDPFQAYFVWKCKKPVYLVHHTLEVLELNASGGISGYVRGALEWIIGRFSIRNAYRIIGVTDEILEYENQRAGLHQKVGLVYPNGIVFNRNALCHARSEIPTFLFVASYFSDWHGVDLLLSQVLLSERRFHIHLVGQLSKQDAALASSDRRVTIHGELDAQQIQSLAQQCWVGLSSFALFRKGMKTACPLKVREYLALGLPVYGGHEDVFPNSLFLLSRHPFGSQLIR
ncbi:MAG: glycosyltransferase, partial [Pedobacter sp.]